MQERKLVAEPDPEKLEQLLGELQTTNEAMELMLDELATDAGIAPPDFAPVAADEQGRLDQKATVKCPDCGHEFTP